MSKLISFFLVLFVFLNIVNAQQKVDMEKIRCIPNHYCDYFETEDGCPQDCNREALQLQRERELRKESSLQALRTTTEETPSRRISFSPSFIILSSLFILLLLSFLIGSYYWIHGKKLHKSSLDHAVKHAMIEKTEIPKVMHKQTSVHMPHLPSKPQRRW